jgi:hypothetical protein
MNDEIRYEHSIIEDSDVDLKIRPLVDPQYHNPYRIKFESKILKVPLRMNLG